MAVSSFLCVLNLLFDCCLLDKSVRRRECEFGILLKSFYSLFVVKNSAVLEVKTFNYVLPNGLTDQFDKPKGIICTNFNVN